jgi:SAM-dependent methyltransferase
MQRHRVSKKQPHILFDKYDLYRKAVQSPETDVEFLRKTFRELKKRDPKTLREDFCGTFLLSTEWIKLNSKFEAYGMDLDPEPLEYGRHHYLTKLKPEQQRRLHLMERNVLKPGLPVVDLSIAMNFSYFIFKTRPLLKEYFSNVYRSLKKDGLFVLDLFGGSLCHDANEEMTKHKTFNYYWDQVSFDPVTNDALFYIHFKPKGMKKQERVFKYDWRMWSIPELRDILAECGFKKSHIYWEGTNKKGGGDGVFTRTEKGEACQSWIAYIAAEK